MKLKLITPAVLATLVAAPASAGPLANAFQRQKAAIGNGLANNSLTLNEAGRLIRASSSCSASGSIPSGRSSSPSPTPRRRCGATACAR